MFEIAGGILLAIVLLPLLPLIVMGAVGAATAAVGVVVAIISLVVRLVPFVIGLSVLVFIIEQFRKVFPTHGALIGMISLLAVSAVCAYLVDRSDKKKATESELIEQAQA